MSLAYFQGKPSQNARLKAEMQDFIVRENLGYEMAGEGEFVALYVRKTGANTLFVGEKLAKFAGVSAKNMCYAGLKDRNAVTEQWFGLQMPGKETPDFSQFALEGVEILKVTRHNRKIRVGSLQGNHFELLLRDCQETPELVQRLERLRDYGFPNYFGEQRFGRDDNNLAQALRWAQGEIQVKDRKKCSFYLSAARSFLFNLMVDQRLKLELAGQVLLGDVLQLAGSHSHFQANDREELSTLQSRVEAKDLLITAPLIGEDCAPRLDIEQDILSGNAPFLELMKQARMKTAYRPIMAQAENLRWMFEPAGLRLWFSLNAGSYATALVRELVNVQE